VDTLLAMPTLTWEDLGVGSHKVETLMMSSYLLSSKMIATKVPIRAKVWPSSSEDEARFSFSCQPHQVMWVQRKAYHMMAQFMEHGCLQPQTRHCSINEWNNVALQDTTLTVLNQWAYFFRIEFSKPNQKLIKIKKSILIGILYFFNTRLWQY
jgi:hypothetical protein